MHSTARTTTTLLLMVSMCLTPTTGFMISTSSRTAFGLIVRNRNTHLFDTEDEANEWYTPPTTPKGTIRRPVRTAPRESVISSAEQLQEFINPAEQDDRLTIVKYHASWCKACANFNLRLDKVKAEHADVVNPVTGEVITEGNIRFASVEWGANEELCQAEGIEKLPTTRFYVNGELIKEVTGGAKKFEQHKAVIQCYLQKQQEQAASAQEEAIEKTLTTGNSFIGQLLDQPLNTPLVDKTSFA